MAQSSQNHLVPQLKRNMSRRQSILGNDMQHVGEEEKNLSLALLLRKQGCVSPAEIVRSIFDYLHLEVADLIDLAREVHRFWDKAQRQQRERSST